MKNGTLFSVDESEQDLKCSTCISEQQEHLETIQRVANIGIWQWCSDTNRLVWSSGMYAQYGIEEPITMAAFLEMIHPDDVEKVISGFNRSLGSNTRFTLDFRIISKDGKEKYLRNEALVRVDEDGYASSLYGVSHDDTAQVIATREIEYMANHDSLTGLYNRSMFNRKLKEIETKHKRSTDVCNIAVCFIDMDDFKNINDTYGHDVGDQFLIEVGNRLNRGTRDTDIVSRFGGDEFALILNGIAHKREASIVATKVINLLKEPYVFDGKTISSQASMGVSLYPSHSDSISGLMKEADLVLYKAKHDGKGGFKYYSDIE